MRNRRHWLLLLLVFASPLASAVPPPAWIERPLYNGDAMHVVGADSRYRLARLRETPFLGSGGFARTNDHWSTYVGFSIEGRVITDLYPSDDGLSTFFAMSYPQAGPFDANRLDITRDGGATWQPTDARLRLPNGKLISFLHFSGPQPGLVYGFTASLYHTGMIASWLVRDRPMRSRDGGRTWQAIDAGLPEEPREFLVSPSDPRVLYLRYFSVEARRTLLYRSLDGGDKWELIPAEGFTGSLAAIDARDPALLYAVQQNRVLVSEDGGQRWRDASPMNVYVGNYNASVQADPERSGTLFIVGPDGDAFRSSDRGATWQQLALPRQFGMNNSMSNLLVGGEGAERRLISGRRELQFVGEPLVVDAGMWWNPAESGWGLSIVQHASGQLFVVWFTYDGAGKPVWQVAPGGSWVDGRTFEGALYQTRASPYFSGTFDPQALTSRRVGTVRLAFEGNERATFQYQRIEGSSGTKSIVRQRLPATRPSFLESQADMWWNPQESGAGVALAHEGERLFVTWYAYDAAGEPTWLVAPDVSSSLGNYASRFGGEIYTTTGPRDGMPFDPGRVTATRVGTLEVRVGTYYDGPAVGEVALQFDGQPYRRFVRQPF